MHMEKDKAFTSVPISIRGCVHPPEASVLLLSSTTGRRDSRTHSALRHKKINHRVNSEPDFRPLDDAAVLPQRLQSPDRLAKQSTAVRTSLAVHMFDGLASWVL